LLTILDLGVLNSVSSAASACHRPKSEDKRNAILDAATRVFAERGLTAAPTSEISKQAGVAEGTLFTYFQTEDDLINALYREMKLELSDAMMSDFPRKKSVRTRLRHVWDSYANWGVANPESAKFWPNTGLGDAFEGVARSGKRALRRNPEYDPRRD
jgi:AcrR family transcriptional regulator